MKGDTKHKGVGSPSTSNAVAKSSSVPMIQEAGVGPVDSGAVGLGKLPSLASQAVYDVD